MADGVKYIKIAKVDGEGVNQTDTLQSLTRLTIPYSSGNVTYDILNVSEFPNYFLYYVESTNTKFSNRADVNYDFTGSLSTDNIIGPGGGGIPPGGVPISVKVDISSSLNDPLSFYNSSLLEYEFNTYTQKDIHIRISGSIDPSSMGALEAVAYGIYIIPPGVSNPDVSGNPYLKSYSSYYNQASPNPSSLDISYDAPIGSITPGSKIQLRIFGGINGGSAEISPNTKIFITSSAASGPEYLTVPEPYFTTNFSRAFDCQPLLNNAVRERANPFLQDLDYQTSQTVPVNYQAVVSGSATKATVPESNYTQLTSTNIRYNGSKIQSEKLNQWTNKENIGTYGKTPSINSLDTDIYEFEWGGGTTPEILGWGSFKMGKILQVQTTESVRVINASEGETTQVQAYPYYSDLGTIKFYRKLFGINATAGVPPNNATGSIGSLHFWTVSQSISDYYYILNGNNPVNTEITPLMYPNPTAGSNPTIPKTTKIVTTEFGVPTISNYALTSSNNDVYGFVGNIGGGDNLIQLNRTIDISKVITDSNGFYQSGTPTSPNWATIGDQIVEDLNNNEKWFVTLYNEFEFPNGTGDYNTPLTSGSLSPYNPGYNTLDSNGNYPNPLAYKGVYEIVGCWDDTLGGDFFILLNTPIPSPTKDIGGGVDGNSLGMLIWKARSSNKSEFVIVQDEVTGGVGAGAFINKYSPQELIDNFDTITRTFGNNVT